MGTGEASAPFLALRACPALTVLLRRTIRDHLRCSRQRKSSMYSSEYTSGFSWPVAWHLAAPRSPRHEGTVGQAPSVKGCAIQRESIWQTGSS
jgi:hypothetical protein